MLGRTGQSLESILVDEACRPPPAPGINAEEEARRFFGLEPAMAALSCDRLEPSPQSRFPLPSFIPVPEPVEAERWRYLVGSDALGGGDDVRERRVTLADPERPRKNDFAPRVRMSSVEMRRSLAGWKEGELGAELEEGTREVIEGLREPGREAEWEEEHLLEEEELARWRKEKGRRSDFGEFLDGMLGDVRMVGVERALERVESGETEGERTTKSSWRSFGAGIVCGGGLVSDCGTSDGSKVSKRSLWGSGRGAKRMRRVEGAEEVR